MDTSPLGRLSGELRNRIYAYFFSNQLPSPIEIDIRPKTGGARLKRPLRKTRSALALTTTSRQLRNETLALFWSTASLRIVAENLTTHSEPLDSVSGLHFLNAAQETNEIRIENLEQWLWRSGLYDSARFLRPVELDLGMFDPGIYMHTFQGVVLGLVRGETRALVRLMEVLGEYAGPDPEVDVTLRFSVRVKADTAMGPFRVSNERKLALAVIDEMCQGRMEAVLAQFEEGFLTGYGQSVLVRDLAMCRSVAEMLVRYIVADSEVESRLGKRGVLGQVARFGQK